MCGDKQGWLILLDYLRWEKQGYNYTCFSIRKFQIRKKIWMIPKYLWVFYLAIYLSVSFLFIFSSILNFLFIYLSLSILLSILSFLSCYLSICPSIFSSILNFLSIHLGLSIFSYICLFFYCLNKYIHWRNIVVVTKVLNLLNTQMVWNFRNVANRLVLIRRIKHCTLKKKKCYNKIIEYHVCLCLY